MRHLLSLFLCATVVSQSAAAPAKASPFAGTYGDYTIDRRGDISGPEGSWEETSDPYYVYRITYQTTGHVTDDGSLTLVLTREVSVRRIITYLHEREVYRYTESFSSEAQVELDENGNLIGVWSDGSTFLWYRT